LCEVKHLARANPDPLVAFERDGDGATVLVVACVASTPERPHYCIFIRRQVESIRRLGLRCDLISIAGYRTPRAYAAAAKSLAAMSRSRSRQYALIHAHGGETALAASAYRRAPLLVSYLGSDLLGSPNADGRLSLEWRLRSRVIRQHARLARAAIVKSAPMVAALPPPVRARTEVIPNGIDRAHFRPRDRAAARESLGWPSDELVVLFASNPARASKRPELARAACAEAARRLGRVRLEVAHGLAPETMPDLMNASDCLLHTSASEGSPNVVKEALACNLPVVATPAGDIRELLGGVADSYVCAAHVGDLADALVSCLDPPRRSNGREHTETLDDRRIAERVVALYERVSGIELPRG
jgi:teichuronic acid biosynthesis glycosyltransferase TuaC